MHEAGATMHGVRYRPRFDWQLRTRTLALGVRTQVMAIINLTPDSFSGDGLLDLSSGLPVQHMGPASAKLAVAAAVEAVDAGADIIDLGAESTRPNATALTALEEQSRLLPVMEGLCQARPHALISVDTYHASTARAAARAGAEIINDVSGLAWDEAMAEVVSQTGTALVLMHARGRPREWQSMPALDGTEVIPLVFSGLCEQMAHAEAAGISTERIVLDPGFGFGKRGAENFALLAGLRRLHELGRPILIGLSRKGFLGDIVKPLQPIAKPLAEARRAATIAANTAAILGGAHVLRVHDVQAAREAAAVADAILRADTFE
jgi:dihydropteroate synthase